MYCPKCGNKITGTAKFCPACGEPVVNDNKIKQASPDESDNMKDKILTIAISVAGVLIIVMAMVFAGRFVMKRNDFSQNDELCIETETQSSVSAGEPETVISEETQSSASLEESEPETVINTGFIIQDNELYYYDVNGQPVIGWFEDGGIRYFATDGGWIYRNGAFEIDGVTYLFDNSGMCLGVEEHDSWKQSYMDFIQRTANEKNRYQLFYMNDDDIPELFIWNGEDGIGAIAAAGGFGGSVCESESFQLYEVQYSVFYAEYQNFLDIQSCFISAEGGGCTDNIYKIVGDAVDRVDCVGYRCQNIYNEGNYNNFVGTIDTYWGNDGEEISEEEYLSRIWDGEVTEFKFYDGLDSYEMIRILEAY